MMGLVGDSSNQGATGKREKKNVGLFTGRKGALTFRGGMKSHTRRGNLCTLVGRVEGVTLEGNLFIRLWGKEGVVFWGVISLGTEKVHNAPAEK